jgi:RNA polymerase sigma-70 factor (ECF subfamily)
MEFEQTPAASPCSEASDTKRSRVLEATGFIEIIAEHQHEIFCFMLARVRNAAAAEDLTQDAFLRAWEKRHLLDVGRSPAAWLFTVAYRVLVSEIRSRRAQKRHSPQDRAINPSDLTRLQEEPWETAAKAETAKAVRDAIDELDARSRRFAYLFYYGGKSIKEIAEICGKTPASVNSSLQRTRKKLEASLARLSRADSA